MTDNHHARMFMNEFNPNDDNLRWNLLICIVKGHKGCYYTDNTVTPKQESYHCYRCKATWIQNDKRERIMFYAR